MNGRYERNQHKFNAFTRTGMSQDQAYHQRKANSWIQKHQQRYDLDHACGCRKTEENF